MPWEAPPQTYLSGNTAGTTHVFGPIVTLQGGANITLSGSGNQIVIKGAAGGAGGTSPSISAGTQSTDGGTIVFSNSNGISFGMSGSSRITASYTVPSVPAQTAFVLSDSNGISWGTNASTVTATVKTAYVGLNTAKTNATWTVNSSGISFDAGGYVGTGTAATNASVTLDTSGISVNVGPYITTARRSTDAVGLNTAQTAVTWTVNSSGISIDAGNYLTTARRSTDAVGLNTAQTAVTWTVNSSGLSIDAGAYLTTARRSTDAIGLNTAQTNVTWTANSSGLSLNAGGYAGTVSGATNCSVTVNTSGVSVNVPNPLVSRLVAYPAGQITSSQQTNATISFVYLPIRNAITFSRLDLPVLISLGSSATANTGNLVITSGAAIYSRNGSTLNPIVGQTASTTYTWASNTANFNSISGARPLSFALATSLSVGEYWVGVQLSTNNNSSIGTATTQLANSISVLLGSVYTASGFADFGALTNGSTDIVPGFGACSVTMSNTTQTYQFSQITATGAQAARANLYVVLRNF